MKDTPNAHIQFFLGPWEFAIGATNAKQVPPLLLPEFAFIGRSNVGKSSLINTLTSRNSLARVSQNPGCTKQINFFILPTRLALVDLPGYGFAKISHTERNQWDKLIHSYLRGRAELKRTFLLIDSRHPLKKIDVQTMTFLDEYGVSYQIVLTKIDQSPHFRTIYDEIESIIHKHGACHPHILTTSSKTKTGIEDLQQEIYNMI